MLFVPYEIETLIQERPWANWLLVATSTIVSIAALLGDGAWAEALVLWGFSLPGLFGHVLLHADFGHLLGNMIFLWVFGNAICANIGNAKFLGLFVILTAVAASVHNLLDGSPAIGASGAINGIVGVVLAMYPLNRVSLFWFFLIRGGTFQIRAFWIILAWFVFDVWGALSGGGNVAYWAHLGGFLGGLGIGLLALRSGWIRMTDCDNRCLLEIIKGETWD
ncbi:MAG: rhomboid family intramembrane serine protease [Akkermansiaceae bacterium]|nr:rhomboid family intramembrane serine protease [Akkermansiaceae bacterium]